MSKTKVLVVEDELIIADNINEYLVELGYEILEPCITYSEAINVIEKEKPDMVILDIFISGKKTGIDVANEIKRNYKIPFIYLTSNTDSNTFQNAKITDPLGFLVKPFTKQDLQTNLELALHNFSKINKQNEKGIIPEALFIKKDQALHRVNMKDIIYLKSDSVYIDFHMLDDTTYTIRGALLEYQDKLNKSFLRVHRSYIANLHYLTKIESKSIFLNDIEIPVAKKQKEFLLKYIK